MPNSSWGIPLQVIHKMINTMHLLLRDATLLLRDIYKLKINTSFWGMPELLWNPSERGWGVQLPLDSFWGTEEFETISYISLVVRSSLFVHSTRPTTKVDREMRQPKITEATLVSSPPWSPTPEGFHLATTKELLGGRLKLSHLPPILKILVVVKERVLKCLNSLFEYCHH